MLLLLHRPHGGPVDFTAALIHNMQRPSQTPCYSPCRALSADPGWHTNKLTASRERCVLGGSGNGSGSGSISQTASVLVCCKSGRLDRQVAAARRGEQGRSLSTSGPNLGNCSLAMLLDPRERPLVALSAATAGTAALLWLTSWRRGSASAPAAAATGFDAYLRDASIGQRAAAAAPAFAATSFDAYLRQPATAPAEAAANAVAATSSSAADVPADAIPVTVLFGTEYGFSKEVAEKACERLRGAAPPSGSDGASYWPRLLDMADLAAGLPGMADGAHQALLLVCSTQGDGVPPTEAREFCDWLSSGAAPQLGGAVHYSVCALGDRQVGWLLVGVAAGGLGWGTGSQDLLRASRLVELPYHGWSNLCRRLSSPTGFRLDCQPPPQPPANRPATSCRHPSSSLPPRLCPAAAAPPARPRQVLPALLPLRALPGCAPRGAGRRPPGAPRGREPRGLEGHRRVAGGCAGGPGGAAAEDGGAAGGPGQGGGRGRRRRACQAVGRAPPPFLPGPKGVRGPPLQSISC